MFEELLSDKPHLREKNDIQNCVAHKLSERSPMPTPHAISRNAHYSACSFSIYHAIHDFPNLLHTVKRFEAVDIKWITRKQKALVIPFAAHHSLPPKFLQTTHRPNPSSHPCRASQAPTFTWYIVYIPVFRLLVK